MNAVLIACSALFLALLIAVAACLNGCGHGKPAQLPWPEVTLTQEDRILILAPHPDDEVLGCGGVIQRAVAMGLPLRIVFFTYGDANQWSFAVYRKHPVATTRGAEAMGAVRHNEALAAAKVLGVAPESLVFLGYPDFGTLRIWDEHWGEAPPLKSVLTRVAEVPYETALRPGAPYKGEEILRDLSSVLLDFHPTKVFLSHPGDSNPDHRALYLFTRVALWELSGRVQPELYPYLIHYKHWPRPRAYRPGDPLLPPALFKEQAPWTVVRLSGDEVERNHVAIKAHRSQYEYGPRYLSSLIRANELFGDFPAVTLAPPKGGLSSRVVLDEAGVSLQVPEQLTSEERTAFIGLERRYVGRADDAVVLSTELSRPLRRGVGMSVELFGYRSDEPFAQMPKLRVELGATSHRVYDGSRELPPETVDVRWDARRVEVTVPLATLGTPSLILSSTRTYLGDVPLDWVSWRVIELAPAP